MPKINLANVRRLMIEWGIVSLTRILSRAAKFNCIYSKRLKMYLVGRYLMLWSRIKKMVQRDDCHPWMKTRGVRSAHTCAIFSSRELPLHTSHLSGKRLNTSSSGHWQAWRNAAEGRCHSLLQNYSKLLQGILLETIRFGIIASKKQPTGLVMEV